MGYTHINNLYRDQRILAFTHCYALEKWKDGKLGFFSGDQKHDKLAANFQHLGHDEVIVYGEAYGGKQNARAAMASMRDRLSDKRCGYRPSMGAWRAK